MNSDSVLDLGEVARKAHPRLRNCLSCPLLSGNTLVGVLTLHSAGSDRFNEDHRRIIEIVAHQVADAFSARSNLPVDLTESVNRPTE